MLAPHWGPGRPRRITDADIEVLVATAKARPARLGLPFTHWSIRKLTARIPGSTRPACRRESGVGLSVGNPPWTGSGTAVQR